MPRKDQGQRTRPVLRPQAVLVHAGRRAEEQAVADLEARAEVGVGIASVEEIDRNYTWPTADWFDYSDIPKRVEGLEDRVVGGGGSEPFLIYKHLRGEEQAFIDLVNADEETVSPSAVAAA